MNLTQGALKVDNIFDTYKDRMTDDLKTQMFMSQVDSFSLLPMIDGKQCALFGIGVKAVEEIDAVLKVLLILERLASEKKILGILKGGELVALDLGRQILSDPVRLVVSYVIVSAETHAEELSRMNKKYEVNHRRM